MLMAHYRRISIALLLLLTLAHMASAQNEVDALRYNSRGLTGTARVIGLGGAFSAVGADFSSAALNPAGLAFYRRSDIMFTPRVNFTNSNANYMGTEQSATRSKFGFANMGYVGAARVEKWDNETLSRHEAEKGLRSYAFAIGFSQTANFNRQTRVSAYNPDNSITDYFASLANGQSSVNLPTNTGLAGAAWVAGLIDTSVVDGNYVPAALGGEMQQEITILESGRVNEWNIGFAANLDDKFYGGVSLGIRDLKYSSEQYHDESDINDVHQTWANDSTPLAGLSYTDIYDTKGTGIDIRLGFIFRPSDFFRFGFSFQSPTVTTMQDEYIFEVKSTFDQDPTEYGAEAQNGTFTYKLTTPFKVTLGMMALFKKYGFISADFDYQDYSGTEYATPRNGFFYDFRVENTAMRDLFSSAYNFRLGGELRANKARFRLGYAMFGNVLKKDYLSYIDYSTQTVQKLMPPRHFFTGGLGYKQESFYLDLAYSRELADDRRLYYTVQDIAAYSPELIRRTTSGNFYMTIGFTF